MKGEHIMYVAAIFSALALIVYAIIEKPLNERRYKKLDEDKRKRGLR